ncbi:MAG: T9SS type A sorting domain-containing protein [Bacteroidales bacterium]|nr:T9SS type A sorting domain-containing protein [Bacteroidales bacterium]
MTKRIVTFLLLFFIAGFSIAQKSHKINLISASPGSKIHNLEKVSATAQGIVIRESIQTIEFVEKDTKEGAFLQFFSEGMTKTFNAGKPDLPIFSRLIEIPFNQKALVKIISYEEQIVELKDYELTKEIYPAQPSVAKSVDPKHVPFYKSREVYKTNEFFKNELVKFEDKGYLRNKHLGYIEISPFEYNPVTNTVKVFNNIEVEVTFIPDVKMNGVNVKSLESPYFSNIVTNTINSFEDTKALIEGPVKYVIVSDRMFETILEPFIEWKTMKGFNVIAAYTDNIGTTTTEIKAYLKDLYDNPSDGISPSFVLLVGDIAQIPAFSNGHVTDLYYAEYTGDRLPEVFIGRFSAETVEELQPQIDKTLEVEKFEMPDPSYLNNVVLIAGVDGTYAPTYGNGFVNYASSYYINSENGINALNYLYPASGSADLQIRTDISNGVALANYTAHCASSGWSDPSFSTSHIEDLTNEHMYPLLIGNCCESNKYNSDDCFGEKIVMADKKGAVGYIGGSNLTYWDEDYWWAIGVSSISANPTYENSGLGAYDRSFHLNGESKEDWYVTQGQINVAGNLAVEASGSGRKTYYWEIYNLMGDPSLTPFISVPEALIASYNSEIIIGSTTIQVVTEEDAYVAVSKDGVLLDVQLASLSGIVDLSFDTLKNVGNMDIVITKQNRQPVIDQILIVPSTTPYIILDEYNINDYLGNSNGEADYGETLSLDVQLKNVSDAYDAFVVNATLTSTDTNVVITDATENYNTILKSEISAIETAFTFNIKNRIEDQQVIKLLLTITGENSEGIEYTWESNMSITVNAPVLKIEELIVDDSNYNNNGVLDPGETALLKLRVANEGNAESPNLTGVINEITGSSYIDIITGETSIPSIGSGKSRIAEFEVMLDQAEHVDVLINIDFTVAENVYDYYVVSEIKEMLTGVYPEYLMSDAGTHMILTRNAFFYDSGGEVNNYSNNENYTVTFSPYDSNINLSVNFNVFDVETDAGCDYDKLRIYNGTSNNDELIGEYCGTDSPGKVIASNPDGALTFVFSSDGTVTESGWEAEILNFAEYSYQVTVNNNEGPIEGAVVEFNGDSITTGPDGIALFKNIPQGYNIPLSITAVSYEDYVTTVDLLGDQTEEIILIVDQYDITFFINDAEGSMSVENAEINFLDQTVYSDEKGKYIFSDLDYSLNEIYTVTKDGFKAATGNVDVDEDLNLIVNLLPISYEITFMVIDSDKLPLDAVNVSFNSTVISTNSSGVAIFDEVVPAKGMGYALAKSGYDNITGTVDVEDSDKTIDVEMLLSTGVGSLTKSEINIYPNPSNGIFNLEINGTENEQYKVNIFDVIGSMVYSRVYDIGISTKEQIDISDHPKGMYFMSVENNKGIVLSRKIIVK